MIIKCKKNVVDEGLVSALGLGRSGARKYPSVSPGKSYVALGIHTPTTSGSFGVSVAVHIKNDQGSLSIMPMALFEIIDAVPSAYWVIKTTDLGELSILPAAFHEEFFHDDLSEGEESAVAEFQRACALIEAEALAKE